MGKKPWHSSEWRRNRAKLIEGKSCEWCGRSKTLVVHHKETFYADKEEYNKSVHDFIRVHFENEKNKEEREELIQEAKKTATPRYHEACPNCGSGSIYARQTMKPKYKCSRCKNETDNLIQKLDIANMNYQINRSFYRQFLNLHGEEISKLFSEKVSKSDVDYKSFKNVMILCKRCHLAYHKGMVLCKVCRENYHKPSFNMCWKCHKKTLPKERIWELELHPYKHPWCDKIFKIKGEWWNMEAEPQMCCIEHCSEDANNCEIALKNWE
jgi:ribosomal protein S27AE